MRRVRSMHRLVSGGNRHHGRSGSPDWCLECGTRQQYRWSLMNDHTREHCPREIEDLADDQRHELAAISHEVQFTQGTVLFHESGHADRCWLLQSGRIALTTTIPGRGDETVETLSVGEVLGVSWFQPPRQWQWTATALTPVTAVEIDATMLQAVAESDPALGRAVYSILADTLLHRMQATRARLLDVYAREHVR
ncbi:cyclic nucleotide-binding domain-containing protein [Rhodococcus sp. MS16]|nr:cyclic nucleotide-binding domain-containing protein [Rhodococcus sp. MS16]